MNDYSDL
jgi:hypothetical protein